MPVLSQMVAKQDLPYFILYDVLLFLGKDRGSRVKLEEDDDDGGFQGPRVSSLGSTPDIPSAVKDRVPATKFTYCSPEELTQNVSHRYSYVIFYLVQNCFY